jgi:2-polyprenyl-3-methyl-5-hydroxy-6-metoxy-1,4-benzoquinol methylase
MKESLSRKAWDKPKATYKMKGITLGPICTQTILEDTKHLGFTFSRYKFAVKMMKDCKKVLEVGCGEGLGTLFFLNETSANITAIDFDKTHIKYAKENIFPHTKDRIDFICKDIIIKPEINKEFDGLVCMDVIEHIHPDEEEKYLKNCTDCLTENSIAIFGTPNKYADAYTSERNKQGHVNMFTPERLKLTLKNYFNHVFLFSMNDEVVHTGYDKMAHYLIALCVGKKKLKNQNL